MIEQKITYVCDVRGCTATTAEVYQVSMHGLDILRPNQPRGWQWLGPGRLYCSKHRVDVLVDGAYTI